MSYHNKTKDELRKEFLNYLIEIKRIGKIDVKIHGLVTELALEHIIGKIKRNKENGICIKEFNPGPIKGKDIFIETKKGTHYAEVLGNDSFKQGPKFNSLKEDIKKLKNSEATKKYLFLLSEKQKEEAKTRLSKQKISLDGIEILTIFQKKDGFI
jgi:antitoxin component YwqK of YwqJK toxin-antitoxin module